MAVPESVRRLARDRQLGELLDVRHERSMGAMVGTGLALFAAGLMFSLIIAAFNSAQDAAAYSGTGGTTHHILAPTGAVALVGLVLAIRGLVIGTRAHYLYSGGLVYQSRGGPQVLTWTDITALKTVYDPNHGSIAGYRVAGPDNLSFTIPLKLVDGRDAFVDSVMAFLQQHDRPVR